VRNMGMLNVKIPDDLEMEFRRAVLERKGKKKGAISEAIEEAIRMWLELEEVRSEKE